MDEINEKRILAILIKIMQLRVESYVSKEQFVLGKCKNIIGKLLEVLFDRKCSAAFVSANIELKIKDILMLKQEAINKDKISVD
jgi:hypothetical protein